jgi:acid phosphatase family membrane protein YuiD
MSTKGSPHSWLVSALQRGDLATACAEGHEIPRLDLANALAIVVLMAARQHGAFHRAGAKRVARLALEHELVLDELLSATAAMIELRTHPEDAKRALAGICARHGVARSQPPRHR